MARIAGVNLPDNQHIVIALTGVFGIGPNTSMKICNETKIEPSRKLKDLSEEELDSLRSVISNYTVEGDLRREISVNGTKTILCIGQLVALLFASEFWHILLNNRR